jgi:hypothetical protein
MRREPCGLVFLLFTDFKGAPPVSDATSSGPPFPSYNGGSVGGSTPISGSAGNACIWAGLFGNLETKVPVEDNGAFGYAFAQYTGPETHIGSQNAWSYAICSGYSLASWKGWKYFVHGIAAYAPGHVTSLALNKAENWCYMDRIQANLTYPEFSAVEPIDAGLTLSTSGDYSIFAKPAGGVWMGFNCLPLEQ